VAEVCGSMCSKR